MEFCKNSKVLRKKSEIVDLTSKQLKGFYNVLNEIMDRRKLVAVTLPEVGINNRVCLVKTMSGKKVLMVNPEIKFKLIRLNSRERCFCISDIDFYTKIKRHMITKVNYSDMDGNSKSIWLFLTDSVKAQHCIDHMDGVLISDKGQFKKFIKLG